MNESFGKFYAAALSRLNKNNFPKEESEEGIEDEIGD